MPRWIPHFHASLPACNSLLRFTFGVTPTDLLMASIVAQPFGSIYLHMCTQVSVELETGIECVTQCVQIRYRMSHAELTLTVLLLLQMMVRGKLVANEIDLLILLSQGYPCREIKTKIHHGNCNVKKARISQLKPHGNQITRMAVQLQWVNLLASVQRFKQVHDFRLTIKALDPR